MDGREPFDADRDDDYEYGYDYLFEQDERPDGDADEPDEELYWQDSEEYEARELAAVREQDIRESAEQSDTYWQDDESGDSDTEASAEPLDDAPATPAPEDITNEAEEPKKLKRQMKAEALERFERAARTEADFRAVTELWDKLDQNRERRERYHEALRGDVPVEYKTDPTTATIFPRWRNDPTERQLASGYFLDYLHDCPYGMHNLSGRQYLRKAVFQMKDEHKKLLFFLYLRLYSPQRLAAAWGQTDRNIRKVRDVALRKVRKRVHEDLARLKESSYFCITGQELEFLRLFDEKGELRK